MSEPRSDINQLLMQVKYNFQVVMYSNTLPCTHAGSGYTVTDAIVVRGDRGIITSSCFIDLINKEYEIQIIRAVHHHAPSSMVIQMDGAT